MVEAQAQEVIAWAIGKINSYENEKKLYNISAIILSILDVVCGIITIFYTSLLVTSVVASILCGTIWGGRFIQLVKTERLAKALKVLSTTSIAYIAARKKRSEYMKNFFKNIKNNPLTIIFAVLGGGIMAFVTYNLAQLYFISLPNYLYIIFAIIAAILTVVMVVILGWDTVKSAILRSARKNLSKDNYNKVVEFVGTLEDTEKQAKQEEIQKALKNKEVEQAKAIIANYEADKLAYDNAKKVVAEIEAEKQANVDAVDNTTNE